MQTKVPKKCSIKLLTNGCSGCNIILTNRTQVCVLFIVHAMNYYLDSLGTEE